MYFFVCFFKTVILLPCQGPDRCRARGEVWIAANQKAKTGRGRQRFSGKCVFFKRHPFNVPFIRTKCSSGLASALGGNNGVYLKVDSEVDSEGGFQSVYFRENTFNVPHV